MDTGNMRMDPEKSRAYIAALICVGIWSGWITLSRMGVHTRLSPFDITLLRFGTAAILTLPFSLKYDWSNVKWNRIILVALGCGFPYTMFSFFGLINIKAANTGVIVNGLLPVIGLAFTIFWFKEKVSSIKYVAVFILLLANIMILDISTILSGEYLFGKISLVCAAIVFSTYLAATRKWGYGTKDVIAFIPITNAVLFFPIWLIFPSEMGSTPISDILIQMIYQGVIVSIFALFLITFAVTRLGSGTVSVFLSYVPAVTALLSFVFLGESLNIQEQCGIVLCSVGLTVYAKG